jgi:ankyrin repeat protein
MPRNLVSSARPIVVASLLACGVATGKNGSALAQENKGDKAGTDRTELNQALIKAASLGQVAMVKDLLKKGADIQWRDPSSYGKTPLVKAILGGRLEVVKVLLENGADINYPDGSGRYPVYFCCISSNVEMLKYLLAQGGDKDINRGPFSILVSICDHGQGTPEMIPILIKAGASPNVFKGPVSPLIAAIQLNPKVRAPEIARSYAKALIENKADVNLKDKREKLSPLQWARRRGDQQIIEMLEKAGAKE